MSMVRTLLLVAFGHAVLAPASRSLAQDLPPDPALRFAMCSGRLSALMEHQWLMQDAGADHTQMLRDAMVDLMEAAASPDGAANLMQHRITAKAVQTRLLGLASFSPDPAVARHSQETGAAMISDCADLLLIALRA